MRIKYRELVKKNKNVKFNKINPDCLLLGEFGMTKVSSFHYKGKYGFLDLKNNEIIGYGFDNCYDFKNNYGIFLKNDKMGVISSEGKIIKTGLESITPFCNNYFRVKKNNDYWTWMDEKGNMLDYNFYWVYDFYFDCGRFKQNDGKQGLINKKGILLIDNADDIKFNQSGIFEVKKEGKTIFVRN